MTSFEVPEPILNAPFADPAHHWYIREGEEPQKRPGRRPSIVYPPRDERKDKRVDWSLTDGTLRPSADYSPGYELVLVNLLRERVAAWRQEGYPNVSRTTLQMLQWLRREGRPETKHQFFAQIEAVETIIFLNEARSDFLQGINVPRDQPSDERKAEGFAGFRRYACKMATGTGKTTVMGMAPSPTRLDGNNQPRTTWIVILWWLLSSRTRAFISRSRTSTTARCTTTCRISSFGSRPIQLCI